MRIDLGAKVRTKDGHGAGHIKQALWDPRANQIIGYVVDTGGLLGHEVVVSPEMVEGAKRESDVLVVDLTKKELDELSHYAETEYQPAPAGWLPPDVYGWPSAGFLWPVGYAEGAPVIAPPSPREDRPEPKIKEGMKVRDSSGDDVGVVDEILVDESTEELRGIVVKRGAGLVRLGRADEKIEINADQIGAVDGDEVRLITSGREIFGREHA
jgi:sporulation protein YlmC with PRC-barrel domain